MMIGFDKVFLPFDEPDASTGYLSESNRTILVAMFRELTKDFSREDGEIIIDNVRRAMQAHGSQNIHEIIYETFRLLSREHSIALYQVIHSHKTMMSFLLDLLERSQSAEGPGPPGRVP